MSYIKPKRVGELSPIDENRFKTPSRTSFSESTAGTKAFYPKRISELSPLSSDDEENPCNNAFLDDSANNSVLELNDAKGNSKENFITAKKWEQEILDEPIGSDDRRDSASRKLTFEEELTLTKRSALQDKVPPTTKTTTIPKNSDIQDAVATKRTVLAPQNVRDTSILNRTKPLDISRKDTTITKSDNPIIDLCTPKVTNRSDAPKVNASQQMVVDDETPYKTFQMPTASMQRVQSGSHHRSILLSASQRKPSRTQIENEFKSQKVLFTTPSVSRPTIKKMNNLTLDDSLQCYQSSPMVNKSQYLSPVEEERAENEPKPSTSTLNASITVDCVDTAKVEVKSVKEPDKVVSKPSDEGKILRINGKEFIIHKRIGQGGSSTVFLAEHKDTKLECALKVVDLHADPSLVEGYIKEVKILASIQDKKNVIRLYEYALIRAENLLYLVMEKGDSDLRNVLQGYTTPLPLYTLMNYWHQMLQAVHYIHKKDVIHSDLKPENFLIVRGRLKLIDFGISSKMAVDATSIIKHSQVGTFNYISPESLMDTSTGNSPISKGRQPKIKISPKSDVWSLGCILYLLLYQKTPFAHIKNMYAKIQAIINPDKQIEFASLPNYYPSMLLEMVKMSLIHNPKERASVADLLNFPFEMVIEIEN